ncbi:hypothetical protein [Sporosarcina limicola]|uniref:Uncharacterized protein n=1 Tax=Sporosarcina limicola TaxID=34101 RepID=A0A927RDS9_9BACL|nr:hypothetical protein [Sporosarcina limicola]MBE1555630.1 hypothetical protein [Sporosarcina limicola]
MNKLLRFRFVLTIFIFTIESFLPTDNSTFWEEESEEYITGQDQEVLTFRLNELQHNGNINESVCEPFEIYDELESECHPPESCKTLDECSVLGDELAEQILERFGDLLTDYEFDGEGDTYIEQELVRYRLDGEFLTNPQFVVVDNQISAYRDDLEMHVQIWEMFRYLIPEKERKMLSGFTIFTDGNEEMLAQVEPDDDDVNSWLLGVDIMDADESLILKSTLLHEYAHLLTLQKNQMDMNEDVLFADEDDPIHMTAAAACDYYFVDGMGCTKENSYLHQFYLQFWQDLIEEWHERGVADDEEEMEEFFVDYEDQFVTDYAVTSPDEDIAEVWTYFILSPRPDGEEIWEQKILFFHQYPEQVKLRAEILSRLLSYLSQNEG